MSGRRMRDCFAIGLLLGIAILGLWSATGSAAAVDGSQESLENASDEMDGEGTVDNPYEIRTAMQLLAIEVAPEAHYVLAADINANLSAKWESGTGFRPIDRFAGTFDGRGHTIENLTIDIADSRAGIFQNNTGTISNITIRGANVSRYGVNTVSVEPAGTLAGENHGRITNVHVVDSRVHNDGFTGGVVGYNVGGTILNTTVRNTSVSLDPTEVPSSSGGLVGRVINGSVANVAMLDGTVRAPDETGGGLIGIAEGGSVSNISVRGTVSGGQAGGIFGVGVDLTIREVFSSGEIDGNEYAGGIAGRFVAGEMQNGATIGTVSADETAGGLFGSIEPSYDDGILDTTVSGEPVSSIESTYAAMEVHGEVAGAIAGSVNTSQSKPLFENVYWDATTGSEIGVPDGETYSVIPLSTAEITGESAPEAMPALDFETIWTTTETYPALQSQTRAINADIATGELEADLVRSGKSATLRLQLTNPSDQRQIYRSDVRFGEDVVGPLTATLDAGEEREVEFDWNVTGVRTALVRVGGVTVGSLTVINDTTVSLESVDSPEQVAVGEDYSVTLTVRNEATETLEIPLTHRTEAGETTERFGLEPGENSITFPTTSDEAGTVQHEVSFLDATVETNTSVIEPARFGIANIEVPETVEIDESFEVTVTIHNDGGFDGEKSVSIGPSGAPYLAESMALEAGAEDQLTASGTATDAGNLEIVVETPDETESVEVSVEESDGTNSDSDVTGDGADDDGVGFGVLTTALGLVTIAVVARRFRR